MSKRPKTPVESAKRLGPSYRATAEFYAQRARWAREPSRRARLIAEAEHYRKLAAQEAEGHLPAPSA